MTMKMYNTTPATHTDTLQQCCDPPHCSVRHCTPHHRHTPDCTPGTPSERVSGGVSGQGPDITPTTPQTTPQPHPNQHPKPTLRRVPGRVPGQGPDSTPNEVVMLPKLQTVFGCQFGGPQGARSGYPPSPDHTANLATSRVRGIPPTLPQTTLPDGPGWGSGKGVWSVPEGYRSRVLSGQGSDPYPAPYP